MRAQIAGQLGKKATAVVAAEDKSRARWAIVGGGGDAGRDDRDLLPARRPVHQCGDRRRGRRRRIAHAVEVGRAANTGLHVDEGLVSRVPGGVARLGAALATVFAVIGVAAAGFRVIRVGLALRSLEPVDAGADAGAARSGRAGDRRRYRAGLGVRPNRARRRGRELACGGRGRARRRGHPRAARGAAGHRALRGDSTPRAGGRGPVRAAASHHRRQRHRADRGADRAVAAPRSRPRSAISCSTSTSWSTTRPSALYRGRFEPFPEIAGPWARAARGEALSQADREFLKRLVRHEHAEGALLRAASAGWSRRSSAASWRASCGPSSSRWAGIRRRSPACWPSSRSRSRHTATPISCQR